MGVSRKKLSTRDFPSGPMVRTQHSALLPLRAQVQSLVGELRSQKTSGVSKKQRLSI